MYERFTDRARRVMQIADQEARRLKQPSIAPEHILLSVIEEGTGVAAYALKNAGIEFLKLRSDVENAMSYGLDTVTVRKLPLTAQAKKVVDDAKAQAGTWAAITLERSTSC